MEGYDKFEQYLKEEVEKIMLEIKKEMDEGKEISGEFGQYLMSRLETLNDFVRPIANQKAPVKKEEKANPWKLTPEQMRNIDSNAAKENAAKAAESIEQLPDNAIK